MVRLVACFFAVMVLAVFAAATEIEGTGEPVEGAYYATVTHDNTVLVRWVVDSLEGVAGFNLYRSTSPDSGFALVNIELLPAVSPGDYEDATVEPHTTYWYGLYEVLEAGGEELLGGSLVSVTTGGSSPATRLSWGGVKARYSVRRLPN